MTDTLEFSNFEAEWLKMERDYHRRLLMQLKKEIREFRHSRVSNATLPKGVRPKVV